jgi:hypothetical protein
MTNLPIIEIRRGRFDWRGISFVIGCCLCWWWKRRTLTWIGAHISKVSLFFTIVAFLACWGLSLASIGTLEGKITSLSTMEAYFGSLFTGGWSYIRNQYRRAMYTWIGAPIERVTFLLAIVVLPIWGGGVVSHSMWPEALAHSYFQWLETCSY